MFYYADNTDFASHNHQDAQNIIPHVIEWLMESWNWEESGKLISQEGEREKK